MIKMFLIKCPKCKQNMKYQVMKGLVAGKSKRCVYCGRSFQVKENIVKKVKN
ncbi:MAG: hypothetical protein V3V78_01615 [Candidatus Woesearchaeota archaeon]